MQNRRTVRTFDLTPTSPTNTDLLADAYARLFTSVDGKLVLDDLIAEACQPAIDATNPNPYTAVGILFKQRLIAYIHKKIDYANSKNKER